MHFLTQTLLLAQALPDDAVAREIARVQRNYEFLSYGLTAAWLIMVVYVLMMVARGIYELDGGSFRDGCFSGDFIECC